MLQAQRIYHINTFLVLFFNRGMKYAHYFAISEPQTVTRSPQTWAQSPRTWADPPLTASRISQHRLKHFPASAALQRGAGPSGKATQDLIPCRTQSGSQDLRGTLSSSSLPASHSWNRIPRVYFRTLYLHPVRKSQPPFAGQCSVTFINSRLDQKSGLGLGNGDWGDGLCPVRHRTVQGSGLHSRCPPSTQVTCVDLLVSVSLDFGTLGQQEQNSTRPPLPTSSAVRSIIPFPPQAPCHVSGISRAAAPYYV